MYMYTRRHSHFTAVEQNRYYYCMKQYGIHHQQNFTHYKTAFQTR